MKFIYGVVTERYGRRWGSGGQFWPETPETDPVKHTEFLSAGGGVLDWGRVEPREAVTSSVFTF